MRSTLLLLLSILIGHAAAAQRAADTLPPTVTVYNELPADKMEVIMQQFCREPGQTVQHIDLNAIAETRFTISAEAFERLRPQLPPCLLLHQHEFLEVVPHMYNQYYLQVTDTGIYAVSNKGNFAPTLCIGIYNNQRQLVQTLALSTATAIQRIDTTHLPQGRYYISLQQSGYFHYQIVHHQTAPKK